MKTLGSGVRHRQRPICHCGGLGKAPARCWHHRLPTDSFGVPSARPPKIGFVRFTAERAESFTLHLGVLPEHIGIGLLAIPVQVEQDSGVKANSIPG